MNTFSGAIPQGLAALRGNLLVGLTLAVVTLPQAIAFSTTLAGLPPHFGIYAAIWGVLFTALLNPSRVFSGGPNTTMSAAVGITLLPVAPQFGSDYIGYALTLILLAGLVQMLFVLVRPLGRMLDLINEPIVNGLICGIGVFLIFKSLTSFGGLPINTQVEWPLWIAWQSFLAVLEIGNLYAIQIGMITLVTSLAVRQVARLRNWAILVGVAAGTAYSEYLSATVGLQNTLIEQIANLSYVGFVLPSMPLFSQEAMADIIAILPGAVTLALLGLFQTVAAMRRMNRKMGSFTDSRRGIFADAVSNCVLPFLSSLPTCASFNRMWLIHSLGGNGRLASAASAVILLVLVLFLAQWIAIIPMPAMAAVIMLLGANMINWEDIKPHFKDRRESIVFLASFLSVLFLDLFGAVIVGSVLAIAYSKWEQAHPNISLSGNQLKIRGNLYYGSLPMIEAMYHRAIAREGSVVIDFSECFYIDREGIRWLKAAKEAQQAALTDRRRLDDRREVERRAASDGKRRTGRRRDKPDRRQRSEF
ncbi:MAG: SulP family inorganic anion transporter [Rhodocyclaceae bacterium]|nr:SulP family inorganic anion transporter [Rhodocyclaceae bacterium]MCA3075535.1 SulP family inorganic anion transporter [Rhodocyclaceae bacterium]MCA3092111.1 SulP family inorganic anion transporter [Rhodocyclaceae bacterium]MCA3095932.1 SulP family inorganic anion transporter [Rhodocyclaceae bacterium]MCA3099535.1 SulP family inorganic anion transporter [Rhodocyclaceae bacterium]